MLYFNHFIIIILFFLIVKSSSFQILKKYGKVENTDGKVIFESKDFSAGDKMYFAIKVNGECRNHLEYKYYSTSEEPSISFTTDYYVSSKASSTTSVKGRVTSTKQYFTIEKKSEEYGDSDGSYLYLEINCKGNIDFENTEKDGATEIIIIVIVVLVVFLVVVGIVIGVCCYCIRKRARQAFMNPTPMLMYGGVQPMYPQQGNMVMMYGGSPVMVQSNRIPYNNNNPNIKYSNIPPSGLTPQGNYPQQNYNMIPQPSSDIGYNSNVINEKVIK